MLKFDSLHDIANPLVPRGQRVKSPVNEHSEPVVHEPPGIAFSHFSSPVVFDKSGRCLYLTMKYDFFNTYAMNKVE